MGGRPPGRFEGKFLVIPLYAWGILCACAAAIVVLGALIDLFRSIDRLRAMRRSEWVSLGGALAICAVLVGHLWFPWGLAPGHVVVLSGAGPANRKNTAPNPPVAIVGLQSGPHRRTAAPGL